MRGFTGDAETAMEVEYASYFDYRHLDEIMAIRTVTAYHEAGHAVVAALHRIYPNELSALGQGSAHGWTELEVLPSGASPERKDAHVCIWLAGSMAELLLRDQASLPRDPHQLLEQLVGDPDYYDDMSKVERILLDGPTTDEQAVERLCCFIDKTCLALVNNWDLVNAVASALLARGSLSGSEFREICLGTLSR